MILFAAPFKTFAQAPDTVWIAATSVGNINNFNLIVFRTTLKQKTIGAQYVKKYNPYFIILFRDF